MVNRYGNRSLDFRRNREKIRSRPSHGVCAGSEMFYFSPPDLLDPGTTCCK